MNVAQNTFENILDQVQCSNLNFKIDLSPFSAVISLKKTLVKDKFGISRPLPTIETPHRHLSAENQILRDKISHQEKVIKSLKSNYESSVLDCEETHQEKNQLESEIENLRLKVKIEPTYSLDTSNEEAIRALEIAVNEKENKIKCYKIELKNVQSKHEKVNLENKSFKIEKENLLREINVLSIASKTANKETKEDAKKYETDKKQLEKQLEVLINFKNKHEAEARELIKKQKKIVKKERKETKKAAESEVKRLQEERKVEKKEVFATFTYNLDQDNVEPLSFCLHNPPCTSRQPLPPPHGPKSLKTVELEAEVCKTESIQSFTENVLQFMRQEPGDTLDTAIDKLEALKAILEPEEVNETEATESSLDELIREVKTTKEAIENLNKEEEYDDDYFDEMMDPDLPRHYWGGPDWNELIFFEDEEEV